MKYKVTYTMKMPVVFEVEAQTEEDAIDIADSLFFQEDYLTTKVDEVDENPLTK